MFGNSKLRREIDGLRTRRRREVEELHPRVAVVERVLFRSLVEDDERAIR